VIIRGDQIYVGRTRLSPKTLQHPLMVLRPMMLLRTIVDQILMEHWKERQPIVRENHDSTVVEIRTEEEREHVVNPQKHSNHVDHFAFTTTGASIKPKDMRHSYGMCMTRMKQCKEKAMQSQATHSTQASRHRQVQIETGSNGN
jgi:hypothetical protein